MSTNATPVAQVIAQAIDVLAEEAGVSTPRAKELVEALQTAHANEGIGILIGTWPVSGSVVDQRVARLDALIDALPATAITPTNYEVGVLFRITPSQGQTLLRVYQARHGIKIRNRMLARIAEIPMKTSGTNKVAQFSDSATLDFAVDLLRRNGFEKGLEPNHTDLTLTLPADSANADGESPKKFFKK